MRAEIVVFPMKRDSHGSPSRIFITKRGMTTLLLQMNAVKMLIQPQFAKKKEKILAIVLFALPKKKKKNALLQLQEICRKKY